MKKRIKYIGIVVILLGFLIIAFYCISNFKNSGLSKFPTTGIINESDNKIYDLDNWLGNYFYSMQFEHSNVEGAYYVIMYTILIYKEENNYYAKLINDGWQTETRTLASVVGDKNEIEIIFIETLPEDGLSEDRQRYEENKILLKLMQGEAGLITSWYALRKEQPEFFESMEEIAGTFFEKID